jgi:type IV secretion system protein VirB9
MKTTTLVLMAAIVAGCSAVQPQPAPPLEPASLAPIVQPQRTVIPPDPLDSLPPAVRAAYLGSKNEPVRDGFAIYYPYTEHSEPIIHVSPLHVTEIQFDQAEHVLSADAGDTTRFAVKSERNHVRIKTCPQGCAAMGNAGYSGQAVAAVPTTYNTNLIVDTDRRTYHITLQAGAHAMETFAFWYPGDIAAAQVARQAAMRKSAQEVADPPAKLNFAYRITGPAVAWKPIQALDDGSHEYLLFAGDAMLRDDAPALYVQHGKTQELVNYEVRGNYYVIDRLYNEAALTQGVGTDRQTVHIQAEGR